MFNKYLIIITNSIIFYGFSLSSDARTKYADDTLAVSHGEIVFSTVIFRHGERTIKPQQYPSDPIPASFFKGMLKLTKRGKQQAYDLGKWYRTRYFKLMNLENGFDTDLIQVNSTDFDRTLMSAEIFLAAMYPPTEQEMWTSSDDDDLRWQPIPVHTAPVDTDPPLSSGDSCDRYNTEKAYWTRSSEPQAFYKENEEIITYTCKNAGFKCSIKDVFSTAHSCWAVYNALDVETSYNLTLPEWTKKVFPRPLYTLAEYYFYSVAFSEEMKRLRAGPLLEIIISKMDMKRNGNFSLNLYVISAHETTITVFLNALGVYNRLIPNYTASVMIELRKKNLEYYVTLMYRNSTQEPPHLLRIPACESLCTLNDLIETTKYLIIDDYNRECRIDFEWNNVLFPAVIVIGFLFVIAIVGCLLHKNYVTTSNSSYETL